MSTPTADVGTSERSDTHPLARYTRESNLGHFVRVSTDTAEAETTPRVGTSSDSSDTLDNHPRAVDLVCRVLGAVVIAEEESTP